MIISKDLKITNEALNKLGIRGEYEDVSAEVNIIKQIFDVVRKSGENLEGLEKYQRIYRLRSESKELEELLSRLGNTYEVTSRKVALLEYISSGDFSTLADIASFCEAWIGVMSNQSERWLYDDRNEMAVSICKKIVSALNIGDKSDGLVYQLLWGAIVDRSLHRTIQQTLTSIFLTGYIAVAELLGLQNVKEAFCSIYDICWDCKYEDLLNEVVLPMI